ncbi:SMI1/KNR4 family protein [Paenibacillus sp. XY044]|uniref:SMI1/KNR4 family protein n=1 Tax=Paenibacillus sp. XY044 TaxID=2026089 RepID=UPI000B982FE0|nr:SMI1/KNR4 family protein [Paenibacillus sp. XY044]OZB93640.1 cell wall assembly protein [Paenibacillus sp. XY044]
MSEDLLEQLETWHEEDDYERIVEAVTEIPAEERNYELVSHLGRALNNLERYEEAVQQFLTVAEEGADDPLWHYRIGLAYYYLEQYDDAEREFTRADELEPGDEDTLEFLEWIRAKKAGEFEEETDEDVESDDSADDSDSDDAEETEETGGAAAVVASVDVIPSSETDLGEGYDSPNIGFDINNFWNDADPDSESYVSAPPTDDLIDSVQEELVFKLPAFYVQMMKIHNGGIPRSRYFPLGEAADGAPSGVRITGMLGIGRDKPKSLCGASGSRSIIENGGYPEFGVVICDGPQESGVVMLDYRGSGNDGEPEVVHVDQANGRRITRLAPDFETFVRGLVNA